MSSLSFSCPARAGGLHSALIFCKLIPTICPFRFAQWYKSPELAPQLWALC
ncbi:hypothetical protein [Rubritalea tangerina]|uniref:hypothetical protein n=1 Tax=Rubritalea tangerina TaxID=430798 RepID=UPI00362132D9